MAQHLRVVNAARVMQTPSRSPTSLAVMSAAKRDFHMLSAVFTISKIRKSPRLRSGQPSQYAPSVKLA